MLGPVNRGHWRDLANLEKEEGIFSSSSVLFFYLVANGSARRGPGSGSRRGGWSLVQLQTVSDGCQHTVSTEV